MNLMTNAEWCIKNSYEFSSLYALPAAKGKHGYDICSRTKKGLLVKLGEVDTVFKNSATAVFLWLDMDHKEPILDAVEKRYLSAVIRPFRDRVWYIMKSFSVDKASCYIFIRFNDGSSDMEFPVFRKSDMYKGMKICKAYMPEELGL